MLRPACAGLLLALGGCKFEAAVPPNVVLNCTTDADCPASYRCQLSAGMCWSTVSDGVAPSIVSVELPTKLARKGTALTLRLTASELLQVPPDVELAGAEGAWPPTTSATPPVYASGYTALGTEPEGPTALTATLTDTTGTVSQALPVGTVTFDFTPPSVVSSSVTYEMGLRALGQSSSASVQVELSEDLLGPPELTDPTGELTAIWLGNLGHQHQFSVLPASSAAFTGDVSLVLAATDLAGNGSTTPLPLVIAVDTVPPQPATTQVPLRVRYHRAPWGSTTRAPFFEVTGAAGSVEGEGTVVVTAPQLNGLELARGASDAQGAFGPIALPPIDVVAVDVTFVDTAGNRSTAAPVLDITWTASPSGGAEPSPHVIETESAATASFTQSRALQPLDPGLAGRADGQPLTVLSGAIWKAHPADMPALNSQLVSAPALAGLYAFDGIQPYALNDIAYVYGFVTYWRQVRLTDPENDGNPPDAGAFGYDELRRTVVMVAQGTTWLFDGASWRKLSAPTPSGNGVLAWDPDRARLVWLGSAGLWTFDGAAWATETSASVDATAAVYDRVRSELLVVDSAGELLAFPPDGGAASVRAPIPDAGPVASLKLIWDDQQGRVIVRAVDPRAVINGSPGAGCPNGNPPLNHQWTGSAWVPLGNEPYSQLPPCGDVAFEPRTRQVVQLTGIFGSGAQLELLPADGGGWIAADSAPILQPKPSIGHILSAQQFPGGPLFRWGGRDQTTWPLTYTPDYYLGQGWGPYGGFYDYYNDAMGVQQRLRQSAGAGSTVVPGRWVVFGGGSVYPGPPCNDSFGDFCGCVGYSMCGIGGNCPCPNPLYSDNAGHFLFFYRGLPYPHHSLFPGTSLRLAYDASRDKLFATGFGGFLQIDPDPDGGFIALTGADAGALQAPSSFTYDRRGFVVAIFADGSTHTLSKNDVDWVDPQVPAPSGALFDLTADPMSGHALYVEQDGRVFEWQQPAAWGTVVVADPFGSHAPPPRTGSPLAPSDTIHGTLLYGGAAADGTALSDTWELRFADLAPTAVLRVDLTTAKFPAGTQLQQLDVQAVAGGSNPDGGVVGVALQLWDRQQWSVLATSSSAAPVALTGQQTGLTAERLLRGANDVSVRVTPLGTSFDAPSSVSLDAIDVTVTARLPGP